MWDLFTGLVGKFNNNWLNFSNFDLLGFRGIMLVPMALPLFHFSDFTCNYIPDLPANLSLLTL